MCWCICFFFFKQKTAYEMRISDWSSDVCSSDLLNTKIPGGNIGTGTEATAVKVSDTGLPYDFLVLGSRAPDLNGGSKFYIPNPDFLLSESGLDAARAYFGLPARSEEHTSELQSLMRISYAVFCLKKKKVHY